MTGPDGGATYETGWDALDWDDSTDTDPANLAQYCTMGGTTWTAVAGDGDDLPISCVNWYEAYAFCIWDGGFLPSEAEWEYSAAGGSDQLQYPWGSTDPIQGTCPGAACSYAINGCNYPGSLGSCEIAPVGYAWAGAGRWGQLDLGGNLAEWVLDGALPTATPAPIVTYPNPCIDCVDVTNPSQGRQVRGGAFDNAEAAMLPYFYDDGPAAFHQNDTGFRCARAP